MKPALLIMSMTCALILLPQPVSAQEAWSKDQREVWKTVTKLFELEEAGDPAWKDMLHDSFLAWPLDRAVPVSKETALKFMTADVGRMKIIVEDIQPAGIVVTGDTAVVHYHMQNITEYVEDGERESFSGRATEVLTRTKKGWKVVSWVGKERSEFD